MREDKGSITACAQQKVAEDFVKDTKCRLPEEDCIGTAQTICSIPSPGIDAPLKQDHSKPENVEEIVQPILESLVQLFVGEVVSDVIYPSTSSLPEAESENTNSPSTSSAGQSGSPEGPSTDISSTSSSGTKRTIDERENRLPGKGDGDGEDEKKRRKAGKGGFKSQKSRGRFACPYRKDDSKKYGFSDRRYYTCATSSWQDIGHLKYMQNSPGKELKLMIYPGIATFIVYTEHSALAARWI